jgi:glucan 1,3-beta-glucosidase
LLQTEVWLVDSSWLSVDVMLFSSYRVVLLLALVVFAINVTDLFAITTPPVDTITPNYDINDFKYKGVAIGGWLVLEPYITPSLFLQFNSTEGSDEGDIPVDEYHFCERLGKDECLRQLTEHWELFYNETDFAEISALGLNMVRIPVGYWTFEPLPKDPYVKGAQKYLNKALEWSKKHDLKVWIDLHGAPGSQNGFDNSGYRDIGFPGWFNTTINVQHTYKVLQQIYKTYGAGELAQEYSDTIIGFEVLNEPYSPKLNMLDVQSFYNQTYQDARNLMQLNTTVVFHDAFMPNGYWNEFLSFNSTKQLYWMSNTTNSTASASKYFNIMIDHHHYEVFGGDLVSMNITQHLHNIKLFSEGIVDELDSHPAVVGEWSAALTDCTPWLNGVGLGARYAGEAPYDNKRVGSCTNINNYGKWSTGQKKNYRKFIEMQLDQYGLTNGWVFWCWKTETSIEWDFKRLINLDLMPQPLNNFTYIKNGTDTDPHPNSSPSIRFSPVLIWLVLMIYLF